MKALGLLLAALTLLAGCATVYHDSDPIKLAQLKSDYRTCSVAPASMLCIGCSTGWNAASLAVDLIGDVGATSQLNRCMREHGWVPRGGVNTWDYAGIKDADLLYTPTPPDGVSCPAGTFWTGVGCRLQP